MSAVITVMIWTSFIVVARASASHTLLPLDIALARILGASSVLLPWAWWLMRPARGLFAGLVAFAFARDAASRPFRRAVVCSTGLQWLFLCSCGPRFGVVAWQFAAVDHFVDVAFFA